MSRIDDISNVLRGQLKQAKLAKDIKVDCTCGKSISINAMFRCHHCGIYFCRTCGGEHFKEDQTGLVGSLIVNN